MNANTDRLIHDMRGKSCHARPVGLDVCDARMRVNEG